MGLKETIRRTNTRAIKKCKFFIRKTNFIGFIIKLRKISIDLKKVKAIVD